MAVKDRLYDVPMVGTALRVQDRYKADAADQLAASIGFFGFLSLFPLIILAVSITGFFLRATPGAEIDVVQAIRDAIPGLGGLQGTDLEGVVADVAANAGTIGLIGVATLLLAGLRVVNGAMVATTRVFRLPQPSGVAGRLRKLGALVVLGLLALAGAAAASVAGFEVDFLPRAVSVLLGIAVTFAFDLLLFLVAYRILAASDGPAWRTLLPGAVLAALGWTGLKILGSTWVSRQVAAANDLYGTFAGIIALLLLLYLAGRLYLYGAELSAYLRDRREGVAPPTDAPGGDDGAADRPAPAEHRGPAGPEPDREAGPPPPPAPRPAAADRSPSVSAATRERLAAADASSDGRTPVRHALAFTIAVGAVAGLAYALRPWESDE